jgi:hypothetical protein
MLNSSLNSSQAARIGIKITVVRHLFYNSMYFMDAAKKETYRK